MDSQRLGKQHERDRVRDRVVIVGWPEPGEAVKLNLSHAIVPITSATIAAGEQQVEPWGSSDRRRSSQHAIRRPALSAERAHEDRPVPVLSVSAGVARRAARGAQLARSFVAQAPCVARDQ